MARPTKQGIDYFSLDTQFDDKIELLIAEKGALSISVLITTWQLIYQNEGYYIDYSEDLFLLIKRRIMIDENLIKEILDAAIKRNIFDSSIKEKHNILTSKAIQKRYFIAAKLKKQVRINSAFLLINVSNDKNTIEDGVNVDGNPTEDGVNVVGNATNVNVNVNVKEKEKEEKTLVGEKEESPTSILVSWNNFAKENNLAQIKSLSKQRKRKLKLRMGNKNFDIPKILGEASASNFLLGKAGGWSMNFDWLIANDENYLKILEGNYRNHEKPKIMNFR